MSIEQRLDRAVATLLPPLAAERTVPRSRRKVTYREFLSDKMLMIRAIQTGVPYTLFELIRNVTPFDDEDWAKLLDLSTKSLHRYKQQGKVFRPLQSEKIIEMAEVAKIGTEVFGSLEKFSLWLSTANFALGNRRPIELLRDSYGKDLVVGELVRIEHGIFA